MDILTAPTYKFIKLLSPLIYVMLLFHLPYIGILLTTTAASSVHRIQRPNLSERFISIGLGRWWIWLAFGFLPSVSLAVIYKLTYFESEIPIDRYIFILFAVQLLALLLLNAYKKTKRIELGVLSVLLLIVYSFHLINVLSLLKFPEKWPFTEFFLPFPLFSISPLISYAAFFILSLLFTGSMILFLFNRWTETKITEKSEDQKILRFHGYGFIIASILLLPPITIWELSVMPDYSLSIPVFILSGLILILLFLAGLKIWSVIKQHKNDGHRYLTTLVLLSIFIFATYIAKDRIVQINSYSDSQAAMTADAKAVWNEEVGRREEIYAKKAGIDPKKGEQFFNQICTSCHGFDKKIIGPPLNDVLTKYKGDEEKLIAFLKKPSKVDPDYPAMPKPALTTIQIKAVVKYLIGDKTENGDQPTKTTEKGADRDR